MITKSIRAILFCFVPGKDADRVRVDACTGWVRHRVRVRERGTYEFRLDAQLSGGEVAVLLLDREKRPLLKLDRRSPEKTIDLDGDGKYGLRWEFDHTTGRCELHWQEQINGCRRTHGLQK